MVRKTFALLEAQGSVPALVFYQRLFTIDPALRALFKGDIESQAVKLLDMLGSLISHLEQTARFDTELRHMGLRHSGYGVLPSHYDTVGRALLEMLEETLQGEFTSGVRKAWTELYDTVAGTMKAGAAVMGAEPPGLEGFVKEPASTP